MSLLNTMGKILEKPIHIRLIKNKEEDDKIIPEQFGFMKNKSSTAQITRIVETATINFNLGKVTQLTLPDLGKVYDNVWRRALVCKMRRMEIPYYH